MLAYDYPILGAFWTILIIFIWVAWIMLVFRVFIDIFRSDMRGLSKALWSIGVILLPYLGVFVYLVANGGSMHRRDVEQAQASQDAFRAYVQQSAGTQNSADQLVKLAELRDKGVLTDAEFESQKTKLLA